MGPTFNAIRTTPGVVQLYPLGQSQLGAPVAPRQGERDMETNNMFSAQPSHTEAGPRPRSTPDNDEYAYFIPENRFIDGVLVGAPAYAHCFPESLFTPQGSATESESGPGPVLTTDTGGYYESNNVHGSGMDGIDGASPW